MAPLNFTLTHLKAKLQDGKAASSSKIPVRRRAGSDSSRSSGSWENALENHAAIDPYDIERQVALAHADKERRQAEKADKKRAAKAQRAAKTTPAGWTPARPPTPCPVRRIEMAAKTGTWMPVRAPTPMPAEARASLRMTKTGATGGDKHISWAI
ncbi:hypothetical protein H2203_007643 [Taxawa tesnikishii (nom. ined.)]|nr:hypothetical protein H2203_007643 [Dothideales sp. JES 119]